MQLPQTSPHLCTCSHRQASPHTASQLLKELAHVLRHSISWSVCIHRSPLRLQMHHILCQSLQAALRCRLCAAACCRRRLGLYQAINHLPASARRRCRRRDEVVG